jgi:hypothetical protein
VPSLVAGVSVVRGLLEITRGVANNGRDDALEYYSIRSSRPAKINIMRMLLQISIPHSPFNAAVKDGTAGQKLGRIVDEIKTRGDLFYRTARLSVVPPDCRNGRSLKNSCACRRFVLVPIG